MAEQFEVVIVGAGPAGLSAALVLARAGVETIVLERGPYPGSKNLFGGILFTPVLARLLPSYLEQAPLERRIVQRRFSLLSQNAELEVGFHFPDWAEPPYNYSFTVLRAHFDRWLAQQAEAAGAFILPETTAEDLIVENGKVVGVRTSRAEGDLRCQVVIDAEGANALLAEKLGLKQPPKPEHYALGVKEILSLPREVIEDRFNLEGDDGVAMEFFGAAVKGMAGAAFLYTNKESLSLGLACLIHSFKQQKTKPYDLLDHFKNHPAIRPRLRGSETLEYSAHLIPHGGYEALPQLYGDGILLVGDAAGLVNISMYPEGTNLAMASGEQAAQTVLEARKKNDFSAATLSDYQRRLEDSFVIKDLKRYRRVTGFLLDTPQFLSDYPNMLLEAAQTFFAVDERPKAENVRASMKRVKRAGFLRLLRDLNRARRAML